MTDKEILKRLYEKHVKKYLKKIFFALFLSLLISTSTASIAWLLDPAIKKIFIEKDTQLMFYIPIAIIIAFTVKGLSLYLARTTIIKVGKNIEEEVQVTLSDSMLNADVELLENKHSGKFISHMVYDISLINNLISKKNIIINVLLFLKIK